MKKIIIETACLIGGQHADQGDLVSVDVETADMLIRHGRASDPEAAEDKKPEGKKPA